MFFSFDGMDGVGKTTQIQLFCEWLKARGDDYLLCRDPGSTSIGESIRELLLGHRGTGMTSWTEMLMYMAARAQLVDEVIRPALQAGKVVVTDRFLLANVVYQGHAGGLPPEFIWKLGESALGGLVPDVTFLLDLPLDVAQARLTRELDRMESKGSAFRGRLREGYLAEAARAPEKIAVIDANSDVTTVQQAIRAHAERKWKKK